MLNDKEYITLNTIIKDIYKIKSSERMRHAVLTKLKTIIDFKFSAFSLGTIKSKKVFLVDTIIVSDFEEAFEKEFIGQSEAQFEVSDYAAWIFQIPESIVYKDSSIVDDQLRKKTCYYKDFLLPNDLPNVGGISIVVGGKFLGALTLFKTQRTGDFTDRDMFILNFLLPHLETRMHDDDEQDIHNKKNVSYLLKSNYGMTSREIEIIGFVFRGNTNEEIAESLMISNNTVKKHLTHIYEKLNISNRSNLIQFILDHQMSGLWENE